MNKTCIVIAGPTAVGKTTLSIQLAQQLSTKIISADSRQCYRELNIGVAKPSDGELQTVQHYFINTYGIEESISAADFENYALSAATEIFRENEFVILTGGTGLYIKAFCEGLDPIPAAGKAVREKIMNDYRLYGLGYLQQEVQKADPLFYQTADILNPRRLMRALETIKATGKPISSWQLSQKKKRNFNIIKLGLELPRNLLYERINTRVDKMIAGGLEAEAEKLISFRDYNALQTVGYKEFFDYFDNSLSLPQAIELIKQNTRHYAKRQMTWFKKDQEIMWCPPEMKNIQEILKKKGLI